jgi:glycopeptide antibiotics resistance protein
MVEIILATNDQFWLGFNKYRIFKKFKAKIVKTPVNSVFRLFLPRPN